MEPEKGLKKTMERCKIFLPAGGWDNGKEILRK
jgi:hypothetical protein